MSLGPTAKQLTIDYGLPDLGDSREKNLNRWVIITLFSSAVHLLLKKMSSFMQFCGVAYQMVRSYQLI